METSLVINIVLLAAFFSKAAALTAPTSPTSYSGGCGNSVFTDGSTYQSNLADLLSVLNSTKISDQLTALSSYVGEEGINRVYGQFLCTPGYSPDVCQDCLTYAASDILKKCSNVKFAVAWYDQCLLRYSDQSNFPSIYLHSKTNVYSVSQERFNETVTTTLSELAREAATRPTWGSTKFAVRESNLSSDKLYTLVQCTVDNSTDNCSACLQDAFSHLPGLVDYVGGRALLTSCLFRFETYPFFNASGTSAVGSSPVSPPKPGTAIKGTSHGTIIGVTAGSLSIFLAASILVIYYFKSIRTRRRTSILQEGQDMIGIQTEDSLQFDLSTIRAATKDFSEDNKLGRGGFGEVHKGILGDGKEIAVKRLSGCSSQGGEEFKNEVMVVAKLQHRNLARLIGFCLEGDEKILIYEFVPNKSLDYFLFDNEKRGQLNWSKRFNIIRGTARGIMYLHEESRLRIIHRDLKSSNILLDEQLNPKISDFGMARIFEADQAQASTDRIVGTYGYMSPEYAMRGEFSIKSDVYSFGVLLLEIIHGRRNNSFYQVDDFVDLVNYVWKHWTDEKSFEVVDPVLASTCTMEEVVRVIHIGLLCVQEDPRPRPTMTLVTMMLNGFPSILPSPKKPGFLPGRRVHGEGSETENKKGSTLWSVDEALITEPHPR